MIKSKTITDHELLKDVHEESLQNPRQKQPVPVQLSGADNDEAVRMSEQHRPDARSISIQQGVGFQKLTLLGSLYKPFGRRGNTSGR
jgi:hypothetical protein